MVGYFEKSKLSHKLKFMNRNILMGAMIFVIAACNVQKSATSVTYLDKQGHRGCRGLMPENTIPAMLKAIDLGVTRLEMDAVVSKDNQVVVSHDIYFNQAITTTPEGKTLTKEEAEKRVLYTMPYDSIRKYDVGLKPHPDFPQQQKIGAYKPLLAELLDATEKYAKEKGRQVAYNIEIKSRPDNDGKKTPPVEEFVDLVMNVIRQKAIDGRLNIQSFDPRSLQVVHRKYAGVATALLIEGNDRRSLEEQLQQLGFNPQFYSPHFSLVTAALVEQCHQKNIKVIPWTVNTLEEMKRLVSLKVDGIITDYPNLFSELK
jgi:glycerophosphoryl diester phosphodiesterase